MDRFWKSQRSQLNDLTPCTLALLENPSWKRPRVVELETLSRWLNQESIISSIDGETLVIDPSTLRVKIRDPWTHPGIQGVEFVDQDVSYNRPPNTYPVCTGLHLAADSNYLYVWIQDRWKRTPIAFF